ncbi:hypothetical protein [Trujillonella humicola]|uniref:hypothetical protein n=1 Tax=Trujillonella humicola TaxID=3383699 RepID=UPI00390631BF
MANREAAGRLGSRQTGYAWRRLTPRAVAAVAVAAVIDMNVGEHDRARRRSAEAAVTPCSTRGHGLVLLAEDDQALTETTAVVEPARSLGQPEAEAYGLWHHSEALEAVSRLTEALDAASTALAVANRIDDRRRVETAHRALGITHELAGDLDAAEAAFASSLAAAAGLRLYSSWAVARLALVTCPEGTPTVPSCSSGALTEAPPLGRCEARVARCGLAVARAEPCAGTLVRTAIAAAHAGGHEVSVPVLGRMLDTATGR